MWGVKMWGVAIAVVMWAAAAEGALWSNPAKAWVADADKAMAAGAKAEEAKSPLEAYRHYSVAQGLLAQAQDQRPEFRTEYVRMKAEECQVKVRLLYPRAKRIAEGGEDAIVEEGDTTRLAAARSGEVPARSAAARSGEVPARLAAARPEEAPVRPRAEPKVDPSREKPTEEDTILSQEIRALLAEGKGTEAVLRLEDVIEQAGSRVTLTQCLLLAEALMARKNYERAEAIVMPLARQFKDNAATLLLASDMAIVKGEPMEALRMLNHVIEKHPACAEAYINLAYLRLAMDADANREECAAYYRAALRLGAKRDSHLEAELNIEDL